MQSKISFDDLPRELQLFVFSFFNSDELNQKLSKVSKKWRNLCADPIIWRKLKISNREIRRQPEDIIRVVNRNPFVRRISLDTIRDFSWIHSVKKHNSVRNIRIWECTLPTSTISRFTEIFPNIEHVSIENVFRLFNYEDVILHITKWQYLKSVKISGIYREELSDYIPLVTEQIKCLEHINLVHPCEPITNETFGRLLDIRGKNIKSLTANFMEINSGSFQLLTSKCVNLTRLELHNPSRMRNTDLLSLQNLPSLENLRVTFWEKSPSALRWRGFPDVFAKAKFLHLTNLIVDDYRIFSNVVLRAFLKGCPKLRNLSIRNSRKISDTFLKNLPSVCSNLEYLRLILIKYITKECVDEMSSRMTRLCYCVAIFCPLICWKDKYVAVCKPKRREC